MAGPIRHALLAKSREAALTAVQTYNNPLVRFKAETYIVLMVVAWTYLLHAYYAKAEVDIRHLNTSRDHPKRKFERMPDGSYKWWELTTCLRSKECPLDRPTVLNLEFLIGLRNEIEHHRPPHLDDHMSARYLACALNYEYWLVESFGSRYSLDATVALALHFRDLEPTDPVVAPKLSSRLSSYIAKFEGDMTDEEFNSPRFAYRLIFEKKLVNHRGQADRAIEFLSPADAIAAGVPSSSVVLKEIERPKYRRKDIMARVRAAGCTTFGPNDHTELWQSMDAKDPSNGFGVMVGETWYWYQKWLDLVLDHCKALAPRQAPAVSPRREATS